MHEVIEITDKLFQLSGIASSTKKKQNLHLKKTVLFQNYFTFSNNM